MKMLKNETSSIELKPLTIEHTPGSTYNLSDAQIEILVSYIGYPFRDHFSSASVSTHNYWVDVLGYTICRSCDSIDFTRIQDYMGKSGTVLNIN